jgi:pimeloyl-ACP methyl ester carboxylesterase
MLPSELRNDRGERLDLGLSDTGGADLVVIGHGVTANKDREWAVTLARGLEAAGLSSLRFSFSGNGASEGRFEDSTVSKEVEDLGSVLDAVEERRVTYAGHSMGAAVGVLRAARDRRIRRLVSLGGMVEVHEFARREFGDLVPGRDRMWDKPECPLSAEFLDDMARIGSVAEQCRQIRVPWLLVHGTGDTVVYPRDSELARQRCPHAELVELEGADHVFSGGAAAEMARTVVDWLRRCPAQG